MADWVKQAARVARFPRASTLTMSGCGLSRRNFYRVSMQLSKILGAKCSLDASDRRAEATAVSSMASRSQQMTMRAINYPHAQRRAAVAGREAA
jgi:hypothetical protein